MFQTQTDAQSPVQKSPLNFVAEVLWEDFSANRPIDGGVVFEEQLRQCQLDGSLGSLQRLDKLLLYIRDQIAKSKNPSATAFMHEDKNRNLLWFIGFYAGNVLAKTWQSTPNWLSRNELQQRYTHLSIDDSNPFEAFALDYLPRAHHTTAEYKHLFFVLEPIGKIVFGSGQQSMTSALGTQIEPTLFDAIVARMPEKMRNKIVAMQAKRQAQQQKEQQKEQQNQPTTTSQPQDESQNQSQNHQQTTVASPSVTTSSIKYLNQTNPLSVRVTENKHSSSIDIKPAPTQPQSVQDSVAVIATNQATALAPVKKPVPAKVDLDRENKPKPLIRQDDFTELRAELKTIDPPLLQQSEAQKKYRQASEVLDKFDKHIAKAGQSGIKPDEVTFSPEHKKARLEALKMLNYAAKEGDTSAMLTLAIYYFLGEAVARDDAKGFAWVQRAATADDIRAQRQLSRLYYQGLGKPQDIEAGRHWLEKAADNGHEEAKKLVAHWNDSQTLMNEQRYEQTVDQRYIILIAMVCFLAVIIIVLVR